MQAHPNPSSGPSTGPGPESNPSPSPESHAATPRRRTSTTGPTLSPTLAPSRTLVLAPALSLAPCHPPPWQAHQHQRDFAAFLLSHASAAHACYERLPSLASANDLVRFPLLCLLRRLCLLAPDAAAAAAAAAAAPADAPPPTMAVVGARELLGLAVMHDPTSDAAAAALQQEASAHLAALCTRHPALVATVIAEAAAHVSQLASSASASASSAAAASAAAASRLLAALEPLPVERWVITSQQLDALAQLMSDGHLGTTASITASAAAGHTATLLSPATKPAPPAAATAEGEADHERGETRRRSRDLACAISPPLPRAPADSGAAAEAAVRLRLGCAVWEKVRWELAPAHLRERALLLLLALRAHVPLRWWWRALLGASAAPLLATPLADESLAHVLRAQAAPPLLRVRVT